MPQLFRGRLMRRTPGSSFGWIVLTLAVLGVGPRTWAAETSRPVSVPDALRADVYDPDPGVRRAAVAALATDGAQ